MNEKETKIQNELKDAEQAFENNPSDSNATRFNAAQEQLEMFTCTSSLQRTRREKHAIFLNFRKEK